MVIMSLLQQHPPLPLSIIFTLDGLNPFLPFMYIVPFPLFF